MNTPGDRLKQERQRLGLTQEAFGARGGVKKLAQIKYEKNERKPDASYFEGIAAAGANVDFILTGTSAKLRESLNDVKAATEMAAMLNVPAEQAAEFQAQFFALLRNSRQLEAGEQQLLEAYRRCASEDQEQIRKLADRLAPAPSTDIKTKAKRK